MTAAFTKTRISTTTALPLLWMLLVVVPRVATAQCTLDGSTTFAGIVGDTITCDAANSCVGFPIEGCDNVICDGENACRRTLMSGAKNVECRQNGSCSRTNIQLIQNGGRITCRASREACSSSSIGTDGDSGKFDVLCSGETACANANITTTGVVVCENGSSSGNEACGSTEVNIEAACLVCNGDFSCDPNQCQFIESGSTDSVDCPASGNATCDDIPQCMLTNADDSIVESFPGTTITCNGGGAFGADCEGGTIEGCDTVFCDEEDSCAGTTIRDAKDVECTAERACLDANIQQIQEGGQVTCGATNACPSAEIGTDGDSGKFDVLCSGDIACASSTSIQTTGKVVCENGSSDQEACSDSVTIEAACLVCNGDFSCDPSTCGFVESGSTGPAVDCPASGDASCSDAELICLEGQEELTNNCLLLESLDGSLDMVKDELATLKDELAVISSGNNLQAALLDLSRIKTNLKQKDQLAASLQKDVHEVKVAIKKMDMKHKDDVQQLKVAMKNIQTLLSTVVKNVVNESTSGCKK